ncbi:MAG TPA: metallophosphoesterase, partial [Pseudonocardiaceae bacterium]|nr:metallophosphoesterase [Pseudonocardiaceae bacterium]
MTRLGRVLVAGLIALVSLGVISAGSLSASASMGSAQAASASAAQAASTSDPVIAAAGDIACDPSNTNFNGGNGSTNSCRQLYTSNLLVGSGVSAVLDLGDNQYYCGGYQAFLQSYDLSWGRVKGITHPAVGNHEFLTSGGTDCNAANAGADGYFKYFGAAAGQKGQGYYSFDVGTWHLIALNSNCGEAGGCSATSPQGKWLATDLQTHTNFCTLAFWHIPLYSSGGRANNNSKAFWQLLYDNNADLILSAHDHTYERFAPQTPAAALDTTRGIREFIIGTGGANHTSIVSVAANSELRNADTFGAFELTLHPASYDWQFVPEAGKTFTDSGTTACHGPASDTTPPTAPANLTATAVSSSQVNLAWTASTDNVGVTGYKVYRNGTLLASTAGTSYSDTTTVAGTTYGYTVYAYDAAGNVSPASNTATVTTPSQADTQPPSTPTGVTATAASASQVNVAWNASTDNVGVAGYTVYRNGAAIATAGPSATAYSDTTVAPSTTYTYTVDA